MIIIRLPNKVDVNSMSDCPQIHGNRSIDWSPENDRNYEECDQKWRTSHD